MDRRHFAGGLMAAGLAGAVWAEGDGLGPRVPPFGPVVVQVGGARVLVNSVIIAAGAQAYLSAFGAEVPQFGEYRVATHDALGGITRPTPAERLGHGVAVGPVVVVGSRLVVLPDAAFAPPLRTVILHGDRSWEPPGLRSATIAALPDAQTLRGYPAVGSAWVTERELVLFLRPVITLDDGAY